MSTISRELIEIANHLPENASYEDAMYELYVREKISKGLEDEKREDIISNEEVISNLKKIINE